MPAIQPSDISITYSGGSSNSNPLLSLGGDPSSVAIGSLINNLFRDVTSSEAATGYTDYRCFYIFNDSATETFYNVNVGIDSEESEGSNIYIGTIERDEIQTIQFAGSTTTGTFTLDYDSSITDPITWSGTYSILATNIQTALNDLSELSEVEVVSNGSGLFTVTFAGADGNKNHPLLDVDDNSLSASTTITIVSALKGSPINSISDLTANAETIPTGVSFGTDTLSIGHLMPSESIYVWLKRSTPEASAGINNDNVVLKITGQTQP